jgi:hypothetical protein
MLVATAPLWPLTGAGFAIAASFQRVEPSLISIFETASKLEKRRLLHPRAPSRVSLSYHCETAAEASAIDAQWTSSRRGERAFSWRHPEFGTNTVARFTGPPQISPKGQGFVVAVELEADDTLIPPEPFSGSAVWPVTIPAPQKASVSRARGSGAVRVEIGARTMPRLLEGSSPEKLTLSFLCDFDERTAFLAFWRGPAARGARWLAAPGWAVSVGLPANCQTRLSGDLTVTVQPPYFVISVEVEAKAGAL